MISSRDDQPVSRRGFTLIELMVTIVIISILSSLTLAGLAVTQRRSKADKTRSTIRKLHEIIVPHYESYIRRRVPFTASGDARQNATNRLVAIRRLMVREMPDSWSDVFNNVAAVNALTGGDAFLATGPVRGYASKRTANRASANGSAECLFMCVTSGGPEPQVVEQFRQDEIGDIDQDGAPEFFDGWNQPIIFLRWAPGVASSLLQVANASTHHDPLDPQRVDAAGFSLVPLIVSGGVDQLTGLQVTAAGWAGLNLASIVTVAPQIGAAASTNDSRDNITNHDLTTK
jgi:prepilin-type N-terminal cleavage/methylation domain-containing protein